MTFSFGAACEVALVEAGGAAKAVVFGAFGAVCAFDVLLTGAVDCCTAEVAGVVFDGAGVLTKAAYVEFDFAGVASYD